MIESGIFIGTSESQREIAKSAFSMIASLINPEQEVFNNGRRTTRPNGSEAKP